LAMAGTGTSSHLATGFGFNDIADETFKVKKPASNSSQEIRDEILRDYFGYTDLDIRALDSQIPGYFYISDKSNVKMPASFEQIRNWKTDAQGNVDISMTIKLIDNLVNFRERRILTAISTAAGAISDVRLRQQFIDDLNKILKFDGKTRLDAVMNLMYQVSDSFVSRNGISEALGYLSAQGYENNPFIQIARANSMVGDVSKTAVISNLLGAAVNNAGKKFTSARGKYISSLDGTDAAYINQEASYLYGRIGNDEEFQKRDWTARFYSMSPDERSTLRADDVITLVAPGPAAMSTPRPYTETQTQLQTLEVGHKVQKKIWVGADKNSREVENADPEASDSGLISARRRNIVETKVWNRKDGTKPPEQSRPVTYTGQQTTNFELNRRSMDSANASAAGPALVFELSKQVTFAARMYEITKYLNNRRELLKRIQRENSYVVPDRPEVYEKLIYQLGEHARKSVDPIEKRQAQVLISRLGVILEQSYALYGR
jgi:hypothetical protein